ncbi:hypothetical protein NXW10_14555 [Bacteroides fragilis]|nr:hypothetical protein NXW10_14555 [Bacteroides fragilis]
MPKRNEKRNIDADWFSNHYLIGNAVLTVTVPFAPLCYALFIKM